MAPLFASGRVIDFILALTVAELALLWVYRRRSGHGVAPSDIIVNILSGMSLMLAVRMALTRAWWGWVALFLLAAGVAHIADLMRRWR